MTVYAAIYEYNTANAAARAQLLTEHRGWLTALKSAGSLYEAGVLADRPGAILAFEFDSLDEATTALDADPFYAAGLVEGRSISEWRVGWGVVAAAASASAS